MKVMLHRNADGHLSVYVPKRDLEEEVVEICTTLEGKILTLANGWQLAFTNFPDDSQLPKTLEAKKVA